jgi:glycosyltransferase involved in cell wall biosynthesis
MTPLSLTYSLADQDFARTKSIGIFNVSLQLAQALAREPRLAHLTVLGNHALQPLLSLPPATQSVQCESAIGGRVERILWDQWSVYSEARRTGNEWLLLPKGFASFLRRPPIRLAVYVHDMMHDVYASEYPGEGPPFEGHYFRRSMLATLREAQLILTNTEFTANEVRRVARKHSLPEPRVHCVGIGFERPLKLNVPRENRILVLTSRWPHKRTDLAVSWLQRWQDESRFTGIIDLVGSLPENTPFPARQGWRHSERLDESAYRELLQRSRALAYFSDHEGFGMPPLEATLAGAAAVFSSLPPTREAMGETGLAFSNNDYASFRRAMDQAMSAAPELISTWGDKLLLRHQWSHVAERTVDALTEARAADMLRFLPQSGAPPSTAASAAVPGGRVRLAFTFLCENPHRQTALTTFFREYLLHSLNRFPELEWIVFAGPRQEIGLTHPRLQYVRDYPANDDIRARLIADHFKVGPHAKRLGAAGLFTIGFAPIRAPLPVFMGVNSLQFLSRENQVGFVRQVYRERTCSHGVRKAALVITNSGFAASKLRAAYPICTNKLIVSHEGTQTEYSPEQAPGEVEALQKELSLNPGYLFWASNFYRYKQAPLFLEAYADLPAELRAQMPVVMVGGDWEGGKAAAEDVIRARGIEADVRMLGWIDFKWLPVLYRQALAYVLPSREETFGRTTTEALASGTPCLLQDIPIMHEIAGEAALIIDFNNRELVTRTLRRLYEDESLRQRLGVAGLERAKKFSFEKMAVERVGAVLNWLAQQKS